MANQLKLQVLLAAVDKITRPLKSIQQAAGHTSQEMRDTQSRIKELNQASGKIDGFRQMNRHLGVTGSELINAKKEAERLAKELGQIEKPTQAMIKRLDQARKVVSDLQSKKSGLTRRVQESRAAMKESGIDTRNLATHQRDLARQLGDANRALEQQKTKLAEVNAQQKKLAAARQQFDKTLAARGPLAARGGAAAAAGAAGIGVFAGQAATADMAGAKIAAQLGQEGAGTEYTKIINVAYRAGISDSLQETEKAVIGVTAAFGKLGVQTDKEITRITNKAETVARAFDIDVTEGIQVSSIMVENKLAANAEEAFDLLTRGMQNVSASMRDELPEILHEYSTHFRGMGFDGKEAMNLLIAQAAQGKFALDKTGDAIKEFSIRGMDMSDASITAYEILGLNAAKMSSAVASGGDEAQAALQEVAKGLINIKDPAMRANTAIALFGTPMEDLAVDQIPQFLQALGQIPDQVGQVNGATGKLADTLTNNAGDALRQIQRLISGEMMAVLQGFQEDIIGISKAVTGWAKENPALVSTLAKAAVAVGLLAIAGGTLALTIAGLLGPFAAMRWATSVMSITTLPGLTQGFKNAATGAGVMMGRLKLLSAQAIDYRGIITAGTTRVKAFAVAQLASAKATMVAAGANAKLGFTAVGSAVTGATKALRRHVIAAQMYVMAHGVMGTATNVTKAGLNGLWRVLSGGLIGSLKAVGQAIAFVGRAALLNPVGLAITAIAGAGLLLIRYWQPVKAFFGGLWQGLAQGLAPVGEAFSAAFGAWASILAPLKPLWDGLAWAVGSVVGWVGKLLTPLGATSEELANASNWGQKVGLVLAGLIGFFPKVIASFVEFGGNLMSGLIDGIMGALGSVMEAIGNVGSSVVGTFKSLLGINSPSKVFTQFGDDTMAGLANGLAKNHDPEQQVTATAKRLKAAGAGIALGMAAMPVAAALPPVTDAQRIITERLQPAGLPSIPDETRTIRERVERAQLPDTSAAVARIQTQQQEQAQSRPAPAAPAPQQHTTVFEPGAIVIHAAPGMDAQELALQVQRQIEAHERRKAAQSRARLTDLE